MDRDQVISVLKRHESELKALGVRHLLVFGSTARNTRIEAVSDVDVVVSFAPGPRGFRRLERLDAVQHRLAELLSCTVDVVEEPARSPQVRRAIEREGVRAF